MSELSQVVDSLNIKIQKLVLKMQALQDINESLLEEIQDSEAIILKQVEEIESLNQKNNALRTANSLLGSENYKRETKLKINSIIREIDQCIEQLSE